MFARRWLRWSIALLAAASCRLAEVEEPCGALPDPTACPTARGGTCADRACSALYACESRRWVRVAECPRDADAGVDASVDASSDATSCDAAAPTTDPSCPPLQLPDCDVAVADACPASACKEGCTGFLRCTPLGWTAEYVAYCDEDGQLVR
ncbi:MAG: hypothetical protein IT374_18000 [Polyangiaceae bacterium]|nr:hypothetical protein [Polyangiaceae bacterium]